MEKWFVHRDSIVREIWGTADVVLFIFAGSAAEFALNKAVDWLYFTGKLPEDPLGRLFSTVTYSRQIIFSEHESALRSIDKITAIHRCVEQNRNAKIPDWAYRDVLLLLIDYSIRSFELLQRKLTEAEKTEVFEVFLSVGRRLQLTGLPTNYEQWKQMRDEHLQQNLVCSEFTIDLYRQYKKHLGLSRFTILKQVQLLLVPERVIALLKLKKTPWILPFLWIYKFCRVVKIEKFIRNTLLPSDYKVQVNELDRVV